MADHERAYERQREVRPDVRPEAERETPDPAERVSTMVGNRAFAVLARDGAGILPDGRAHPDVEATIARTRGSGTGLDAGTRERIAPQLGDSLGDVRVHTDSTADSLSRSVSARAFTVGSDLYFANGEYQPGSRGGDKLIAHELTHVVQQRGAPANGPLSVSKPGDALENEAESVSNGLPG